MVEIASVGDKYFCGRNAEVESDRGARSGICAYGRRMYDGTGRQKILVEAMAEHDRENRSAKNDQESTRCYADEYGYRGRA